ncbi:hypothetical protein FGG08_005609 [Glutinoglossum americanum]|uniref:Uncharacterized protein n=1 Tax=Glutinoglossum americanum TaxID=1670608 RepID=A0A9P8L1P2_9PEZI|nr:hypothetical protein FGG08_005609 [Glutinoglossum americanum]
MTLAEKDKFGNKKKVWSYKDADDFMDVLWFAIAPLLRPTYAPADILTSRLRLQWVGGKGKGRKDPETLACVLFIDEVDLLSRSDLNNIIGKKSTEVRIGKYCKEMDLTPPWEVQSDIIRVPRGGNINRGESKLTERLVALENKISGFDTSKPGETSLRDILAKLENRMASVEQKLSKVDEIEKASIGLATLVDVLCEKVGLVQTSAAGKK